MEWNLHVLIVTTDRRDLFDLAEVKVHLDD